MILQSLVNYYEQLVQRGSISPPGWSDADVSYALWLSEDGTLEKVVSLKTKDEKGKLKPQKMMVPEQVKRSSGINPNFLCDNSRYFLGIDGKGDAERSHKCFLASANLHKDILKDVNSKIATAVTSFFDKWDIDAALKHPAFEGYLDDILKGGNIYELQKSVSLYFCSRNARLGRGEQVLQIPLLGHDCGQSDEAASRRGYRGVCAAGRPFRLRLGPRVRTLCTADRHARRLRRRPLKGQGP